MKTTTITYTTLSILLETLTLESEEMSHSSLSMDNQSQFKLVK